MVRGQTAARALSCGVWTREVAVPLSTVRQRTEMGGPDEGCPLHYSRAGVSCNFPLLLVAGERSLCCTADALAVAPQPFPASGATASAGAGVLCRRDLSAVLVKDAVKCALTWSDWCAGASVPAPGTATVAASPQQLPTPAPGTPDFCTLRARLLPVVGNPLRVWSTRPGAGRT